MDEFCFSALGGGSFEGFFEEGSGVAIFSGASVDGEYFHERSSFQIVLLNVICVVKSCEVLSA